MEEGELYSQVGLMCGTTEDPNGRPIEVIGLLFPTGIGDEEDVKLMTIAAAKALLLDLKEAIDIALEHQNKK
jgi:hypothetical protein